MKLKRTPLPVAERAKMLKYWIEQQKGRLGLITSVNGSQLITLALDVRNSTALCWETALEGDNYYSLTPAIPQCHWYERTIWDLFGLYPEGHPRLKHVLLHEPHDPALQPLRLKEKPAAEHTPDHRLYKFLEVKGEGVYEIPVGPIHAGIIEPGHFRFSCLGEIVVNLEIRLGYVHRGVEKRLTEVPWKNARFVAEAAASDTAAANALAHATALESIFNVHIPARAQFLRTISLEIERIAMHIADLGGIAGDIGFLAISSSMARLRGNALRLGELLAGTRFQRAFIYPGGVAQDLGANLDHLKKAARQLKADLSPVIDMFLDNQVARDRMEGVGKVSRNLAKAFGLVGVAARASGISYDCRQHFPHGVYPQHKIPVAVESNGDVLSRVNVRIAELYTSLNTVDQLLEAIPEGSISTQLPDKLPTESVGLGIVEAHRGELIHLVFTDSNGAISRYAIKDPSFNNWTGLAIGVRNNLVADFPLCNKSFSLSYSGHDL